MEERERILDLVKKGILSSEEALVLLENLATPRQVTATSNSTVSDAQPTQPSSTQRLQEQLEVLAAKEQLGSLTSEEKEQQHQLAEKLATANDSKSDQADHQDQADEETEQDQVSFDKMTSWLNDLGTRVYQQVNDTMSQIDWDNIKVLAEGGEKFEFDQSYKFSDADSLVLHNLNGHVTLQPSTSDDFTVSVKGRSFWNNTDGEAADDFADQLDIHCESGSLTLELPSKRIRANLTLGVPQRIWKRIAIKTLNGDIQLENVQGKRIKLKTVNGQIKLNQVSADVLKTETVNGQVKFIESTSQDFVAHTGKGNILIQGAVIQGDVSTLMGEIKATLSDAQLTDFRASAIQGTIKVSLPEEIGFTAELKSTLSGLHTLLHSSEIVSEDDDQTNKHTVVERGDQQAKLSLSSTTGSIYFKDFQN